MDDEARESDTAGDEEEQSAPTARPTQGFRLADLATGGVQQQIDQMTKDIRSLSAAPQIMDWARRPLVSPALLDAINGPMKQLAAQQTQLIVNLMPTTRIADLMAEQIRAATAIPILPPTVLNAFNSQIAVTTQAVATVIPTIQTVLAEQYRATGPVLEWALKPSIDSVLSAYRSPFQDVLARVSEQARLAFPDDLLSTFTGLFEQVRQWIPENLRDLDPTKWPWLLRIAAKDGTCLAWAPGAEKIQHLISLQHSTDRHRYLLEQRHGIVHDVEQSLELVDHPELDDVRDFTLEAAACIHDGRYAAAQALLGNVLDTVMLEHGNRWLTSYFPQAHFAGTGNHKMIEGALGTTTGGSAQLQMMKLAPYLLVASMKNVFRGKVQRQDTFNRHLGAHKASAHSYRAEFAVTALLTTQGLLRQMDRYLYSQQP